MAKRPDIPAGARFREWLKSCYGSIGAAAEAYEMKPESLNPYFKGDLEIGGVWIDRIESNGGDYYYILTGRRPDSEEAKVYGGSKTFVASQNVPVAPDRMQVFRLWRLFSPFPFRPFLLHGRLCAPLFFLLVSLPVPLSAHRRSVRFVLCEALP